MPTKTPWPTAPLPATPAAWAAALDQTLLGPLVTADELRRFADESAGLGCAALCVGAHAVPILRERLVQLDRPGQVIAATVAFPHGTLRPDLAALEAKAAWEAGAREIDLVADLGALKSGDGTSFRQGIRRVAEALPMGAPLKVILETAAFPAALQAQGARWAVAAGATTVKTSTGFHPAGGASEAAVRTLRRAVGPDIGVKASGGIRTLASVARMLEAGADRIGTSAGLAIVGAARVAAGGGNS